MTIRATGRAEIEILLSLEEARWIYTNGAERIPLSHGDVVDLGTALRREEAMQEDAEEGSYASA